MSAQAPPLPRSARGWRLRLSLQIALRYLRGGRSNLLRGTTRAAAASTGLGVTAMVIAMALMTGYTEEVQNKLLELGAILVYPQVPGGFGEDALGPGDPRPADLLAVPGVNGVAPVVYGHGSLSSAHNPAGVEVVLRGVTPGAGRFTAPAEQLVAGDGVLPVVLGADLMRRLRVAPGEHLRLMVVSLEESGARFRWRLVRVGGSFASGFSQFDRSHVLVAREQLQALAELPLWYEVSVARLEQLDRVRTRAQELLGDHYLVSDWRRQNPGLFTALRLQKWALFLILGLIVVVSTFNVASTLIVLIREKTRDVGTLQALGLRPADIVRVFVFAGLILGAIGVASGLLLGGAVATALDAFRVIRFDPEVAAIYFIDAVPFRIRAFDWLAISAFSLGVVVLGSLLPARQAAALLPAVAVRYE